MKRLIIAFTAILIAGFAFGQTLEKGGVLALHHHQVTLAPGVTIDQYFDFMVDKVWPEMEKVFPNLESGPTHLTSKVPDLSQRPWGGQGD